MLHLPHHCKTGEMLSANFRSNAQHDQIHEGWPLLWLSPWSVNHLWQKPELQSETQIKATKGVELTTDHKWTPSHAVKTYSSCTELPHHHQTTLSNTFRSPASGFSVSESSSSYKTRIYRIKLKEQAWQVTEQQRAFSSPAVVQNPFHGG